MHSPVYNSALFLLYGKDSFAVDYPEYVRAVLGRKHYGQTRKYSQKIIRSYFYTYF